MQGKNYLKKGVVLDQTIVMTSVFASHALPLPLLPSFEWFAEFECKPLGKFLSNNVGRKSCSNLKTGWENDQQKRAGDFYSIAVSAKKSTRMVMRWNKEIWYRAFTENTFFQYLPIKHSLSGIHMLHLLW